MEPLQELGSGASEERLASKCFEGLDLSKFTGQQDVEKLHQCGPVFVQLFLVHFTQRQARVVDEQLLLRRCHFDKSLQRDERAVPDFRVDLPGKVLDQLVETVLLARGQERPDRLGLSIPDTFEDILDCNFRGADDLWCVFRH